MKVPVAPHSYHHLVVLVFWILAILRGVSQYLIIFVFPDEIQCEASF